MSYAFRVGRYSRQESWRAGRSRSHRSPRGPLRSNPTNRGDRKHQAAAGRRQSRCGKSCPIPRHFGFIRSRSCSRRTEFFSYVHRCEAEAALIHLNRSGLRTGGLVGAVDQLDRGLSGKYAAAGSTAMIQQASVAHFARHVSHPSVGSDGGIGRAAHLPRFKRTAGRSRLGT